MNWFYLAVISSVFFGFQMVFIKYIMNRGLNAVLAVTYVFTITTIILWGYTFLTEKSLVPDKNIMMLLLFSSVIVAIANITVFKALDMVSNPGYVRAIGSLSIVIAFLLSVYIFKLNINPIGIAGIAIIILGTIVLSMVS